MYSMSYCGRYLSIQVFFTFFKKMPYFFALEENKFMKRNKASYTINAYKVKKHLTTYLLWLQCYLFVLYVAPYATTT